MELLFNTNVTHAEELQEILGFIDSDFSMNQLLPYITKASREIFKLIGETNYNIALEKFNDDDFEDPFLKLLKYSIALGAFREFAPLQDLSFTTNGRVFRSDDHMKGAFEWMIDKSDDALERSYYASIDEILAFVTETTGYVTSAKIQNVSELFVNSLDVFQEFVNINDSHLLYFKLVPSLKMAENQLIKSRVGNKFSVYKGLPNTAINNLIKNICVYFAMKDGLKKNSVQLFPRGVLKVVPGNTKHSSASAYDVEATALYYSNQIDYLLQYLELEIKKDKQTISNARAINFCAEDGFVTM